jgi:hypothetical protein
VLTRLAEIYTLVNEPDEALDTRAAAGDPELDQPRRASERPHVGAASRASPVRASRGARLTARAATSYIGLMRPETRRNRNPLSIDHAFT